jgi:hypothetical protein
MLGTLERMSWLVVLLATATFIAYLQPPGGFESNQVLVGNSASCSDVQQELEAKGVTPYMQCAMLAFFVLDGLSFGLSMGCLTLIVVMSMPRIQWASERAQAGRFYIYLLCTWLLLYFAVLTGFAAFVASGLAVNRQVAAVVVPVVPGILLLAVGLLAFVLRFWSLFPGKDIIWEGRPNPFLNRALAPAESDVELGQARFWREWPVVFSRLEPPTAQPAAAAAAAADEETAALLASRP